MLELKASSLEVKIPVHSLRRNWAVAVPTRYRFVCTHFQPDLIVASNAYSCQITGKSTTIFHIINSKVIPYKKVGLMLGGSISLLLCLVLK